VAVNPLEICGDGLLLDLDKALRLSHYEVAFVERIPIEDFFRVRLFVKPTAAIDFGVTQS
jgi:hypothetical protein